VRFLRLAARSALLAATVAALATATLHAGTPVERHGRLQVSGNRIVGAHGEAVSLAGVSYGWSNWDWSRFYNPGTVETLARDWNAGIVRAALGIQPSGYLSTPEENEARVRAVIEAAIASGIYVIIDWHDHHAHEHTDLAVAFFERMARDYGESPNVIYEIYNEPLKNTPWGETIKPYAVRVIAAIRAIDPDNLIIVGTENWSQYVDDAAADPIADPNVAYALHFYAGTHKAELRERAVKALNSGAALFVSEWGVCNSDGNGPIDRESVAEWMDFIREWKLSHCVWSLGDKRETASILKPGAPSDGGWTDDQLTESGLLARESVRGWSK